MDRLKGSNNKTSPKQPEIVTMSVEDRLEFLANIIVDRIMYDQNNGQKLLKRIGGNHDAGTVAPA